MAKFFWSISIVCLATLVGCGETPVNEEVKNLDVSTPTIEFGDPVGAGTVSNDFDTNNSVTTTTDSDSLDKDAKNEFDTSGGVTVDTTNKAADSSLEFAPPKNAVEFDE